MTVILCLVLSVVGLALLIAGLRLKLGEWNEPVMAAAASILAVAGIVSIARMTGALP